MKKLYAAFIAVALVAGFSACATTKEEAPVDRPAGAIGQTAIERLFVDAIDYKNRTAILKDAAGTSHFITAGPEIRNFPQLKVGDEVIVEHTQSVAIVVDKPQGTPAGGQAQSFERAPLGAKPGMSAASVVAFTAMVERINYDTREITLKGPEGKVITSKVDPSITRFNEVKKGDMLYIQLTEELAIRVEAPKKQ